jgi:hypothetical protein
MDDKRPEGGVDAANMHKGNTGCVLSVFNTSLGKTKDLDDFYKATEGKIGTDEKALCHIIKHRSREHLWAMNEE